jgi:hypothetical protein
MGEGLKVTFIDHSRDFHEPSSPVHKKLWSWAGFVKGFAVPNPLFIQIHSAIAGVLNMSGAGEHIDQALDRVWMNGRSFNWGWFCSPWSDGKFGSDDEASGCPLGNCSGHFDKI